MNKERSKSHNMNNINCWVLSQLSKQNNLGLTK